MTRGLGRAGDLRLHHIHLPSDAARNVYPSYARAAAIQARLQRALLDFKSTPPSQRRQGPPPPTLLTFTPSPTYTLGRRQQGESSSPSSSSSCSSGDVDLAALGRPLTVRHPRHPPATAQPLVLRSQRGGLTTYHGPGQVVLWPVVDLQPGAVGVRAYADLLQDATAAVLEQPAPPLVGLATARTCDPGVWVAPAEDASNPSSSSSSAPPRKLAALGVHLRRHVTGLGVAVNLATPATAHGHPADNPWLRFVPCGLPGKAVSSVYHELHPAAAAAAREWLARDPDPGRAWAAQWARVFAARMGLPAEVVEVAPPEDDGLTAEAAAIEETARVAAGT